MKKMLYIAPQNSLPYSDGGKIGIFFPAKYFTKYFDITMTFPILNIDDDLYKKYAEHKINILPFQLDTKDNYLKYPLSLLSNLSFKFSKFYNKKFLKKMSKYIKENQIEVIWCSSAQMAKYAIELKKKYPHLKIFLREHNIEYKLVKQYIKSCKNPLMKLISYFEYLKTRAYEVSIWNKFNKIFFISDTDLATAKRFNKNFNETNLIYDGMEINDIQDNIEVEENSFIFTGSLNSFQNQNNLNYFIKNIWIPFSRRVPEAKLYITGNKEETLLAKLDMSKEMLAKYNIVNLGFVDDIKKTILSKQFVISPTLYGSGIRLKVLEALSLKKVVFVSDIDYEMASCFKDMENIVHYSNFEDFYSKYQRLKNDKSLCDKIEQNAYNLVSEFFNWNRYVEKVVKEILNSGY